jgi:hypothetical protein
LKDGNAKDDTNVTKVDVHKLAQRDSPDADQSKEKELLRHELIESLMRNKPKKTSSACIMPKGSVLSADIKHYLSRITERSVEFVSL